MNPTEVTEPMFNLVLNGGAFGVLVFIAFFLIRNIPTWIKDHLATVTLMAEHHRKEAETMQANFSRELSMERAVCDRHHENVLMKLEQSNATTLAAFQSIEKSIDRHHDYAVAQLASLSKKDHPSA